MRERAGGESKLRGSKAVKLVLTVVGTLCLRLAAAAAALSRVVVVLGYSNGARPGLHQVRAARLAHAARLSGPDDVVVLSGWSRVPGGRAEAELMAQAWAGRARRVVVDPDARTTAENAANALDDIVRDGASDVVVVTSSWHAPRAGRRSAGSAAKRRPVTTASPRGRSLRASLREPGSWAALLHSSSPALEDPQLSGTPQPDAIRARGTRARNRRRGS